GRARQTAAMLLELVLEPLEQRERIGRGAREADHDLALRDAAHLLGLVLQNGLAERDLPVAGHRRAAIATARHHRAGPNLRSLTPPVAVSPLPPRRTPPSSGSGRPSGLGPILRIVREAQVGADVVLHVQLNERVEICGDDRWPEGASARRVEAAAVVV